MAKNILALKAKKLFKYNLFFTACSFILKVKLNK